MKITKGKKKFTNNDELHEQIIKTIKNNDITLKRLIWLENSGLPTSHLQAQCRQIRHNLIGMQYNFTCGRGRYNPKGK